MNRRGREAPNEEETTRKKKRPAAAARRKTKPPVPSINHQIKQCHECTPRSRTTADKSKKSKRRDRIIPFGTKMRDLKNLGKVKVMGGAARLRERAKG